VGDTKVGGESTKRYCVGEIGRGWLCALGVVGGVSPRIRCEDLICWESEEGWWKHVLHVRKVECGGRCVSNWELYEEK